MGNIKFRLGEISGLGKTTHSTNRVTRKGMERKKKKKTKEALVYNGRMG